MRYEADHKQETRSRVIKAAARAIRAHGPHKVGVAAIMAEVGLTHGGFYAHFPSKDDLVAEAIGEMFAQGGRRMSRTMTTMPPADALAAYVDFYLSIEHRDARSTGCPLPFLAADAPRLPAAARERFARGARALADRLTQHFAALDRADPSADGQSLLAEMVGALSLARADPDEARSDALLATSRAALKARFHLES